MPAPKDAGSGFVRRHSRTSAMLSAGRRAERIRLECEEGREYALEFRRRGRWGQRSSICCKGDELCIRATARAEAGAVVFVTFILRSRGVGGDRFEEIHRLGIGGPQFRSTRQSDLD